MNHLVNTQEMLTLTSLALYWAFSVYFSLKGGNFLNVLMASVCETLYTPILRGKIQIVMEVKLMGLIHSTVANS